MDSPPPDGWTGGVSHPPRTPPLCFRLRRYGRRNFRPKNFSSENFFGRKLFRSKNFSAENFAVRIAEGGSNGGVRGGREPPPVRPSVRTSVLGLPVRGSGNWFGSILRRISSIRCFCGLELPQDLLPALSLSFHELPDLLGVREQRNCFALVRNDTAGSCNLLRLSTHI